MANPEMNVQNQPERKKIVNTSGQGPTASVPDAVAKKFNWGAFLLSWIWGLFHHKYITLLIIPAAFIPFVGIFVNLGLGIWFGIEGNKWAWQGRRYQSIAQFHESQKKWATAGLIVIVLSFVLGVVASMLFGAAMLSNPQLMQNM